MTKTLEISPDLIERARALTLGATDEEAILAAVRAFVERNEPLNSDRSQRQKDFVKFLGTSDGFFTAEDLDQLRASE